MTSGNLLADRRLELARALKAAGDAAAALSLLEQAIELAPDWSEAQFLCGEWLAEAGRRDEAVAAYTRCLALDPEDRLGAIIRLALLGAAAEPPPLPPAYIASLFDEHAAGFDAALLQRLDYQVPALLEDAVRACLADDVALGAVLDLGCGTGLAAERFRRRAAWLEGVDLSAGMLREAGRRGIYDGLTQDEATAFLGRAGRRYDLVLAADVLVYLGDLAPLFAAVAAVLAPGGRFACSAEAAPSDGFDGFRLTAGHRFAHGARYMLRQAEAAGLIPDVVRHAVVRSEAGQPVAGLILVARRPESLASALDLPSLALPGVLLPAAPDTLLPAEPEALPEAFPGVGRR